MGAHYTRTAGMTDAIAALVLVLAEEACERRAAADPRWTTIVRHMIETAVAEADDEAEENGR